jgi:hypothetical protein
MSNFDWSDSEVVVVRSYGDIAIYINGHGTDIAIRQEDQFDTDEAVVVVPIDSAEKVATGSWNWRKSSEPVTSSGSSRRKMLQSRRKGHLPWRLLPPTAACDVQPSRGSHEHRNLAPHRLSRPEEARCVQCLSGDR